MAAEPTSRRRRPRRATAKRSPLVWAGSLLFTAVLLAVLAVVGTQVHATFTAKPPATTPPKAEKPVIAETKQVQTLMKLPAADAKKFASEGQLLFRTPSGNEICAIVANVANPGVAWVHPVQAEGTEQPAGSGVLCVMVRGAEPKPSDVRKCSEGPYKGAVASLWKGGVSYGQCRDGYLEVQDDARKNERVRMQTPQLNYGQRLDGRGFSCASDGSHLTCVHVASGRGFTVSAADQNTF